ncbi:MAG TPA: hypothetical protein VFN61_06540 [Acidimicrobiales bacterium]|nr:hypothetical protein [Acidimicrobiales bacterium]
MSLTQLTLLGRMFAFARFSGSGSTTASTVTRGSTRASVPVRSIIAVVISPSTKYEKIGPGSLSSLKTGECATAFGTANDIGAVTATRVSVSPAPAGGCPSAGAGGDFGLFGGFGGFRGGGNGPASGVAPGAPAGAAA